MDALTPNTAGQAGLSRSALYRGARAGRLDRIARGIYLPAAASAADWDQIEAATRRPDATICLISALAHYDLTDEIPRALDVAIPRGSRTPASTGAIAWHQFDRATFEIGREQITIPGSDQTIGIYSPDGRLPTRSGSAAKSDTSWRATRCGSGCAEAVNRLG